MRVRLTPQFIATAKADAGAERTVFWDEGLPGFGFVVTANRSKSFAVQYRANGKSRRIGLKAALSLSEARKEAKAILGNVAKGSDPLAERRKAAASASNTLQAICESYFKREAKNLRSIGQRERALRRLVYPRLGARQIEDIRRSEIVQLLDHIEDAHGPTMSDRCLAYLRRILSWYAGRSDDFRSPIVRSMNRVKPAERARERILSDDEIRKVWSASERMKSNLFGALIRFLLVTAVRKHEASRMLRSEIDGNVWTIPGARNKSKRDHVVPLSAVPQNILASVPVVNNSDRVFTHDGRTFLGGFDKQKRLLDQASGVTDWRLHDLRRTARSLLSRAGVSGDVAERCLGHVIGGVRGVYDRHEYLEEKRHAFEALATLIERILDPKENVVPLRGQS